MVHARHVLDPRPPICGGGGTPWPPGAVFGAARPLVRDPPVARSPVSAPSPPRASCPQRTHPWPPRMRVPALVVRPQPRRDPRPLSPPVPKRGCPRALVHSPWGLLGGRPFAHPAPRRLQPLRGLRAGCPGLPPADYVGQALAQAAAAPGPCGGMRSITRQTQQAPPPQRRQHSADDWGRGLSGCRPCGSPVIRCAVCSRWSRVSCDSFRRSGRHVPWAPRRIDGAASDRARRRAA